MFSRSCLFLVAVLAVSTAFLSSCSQSTPETEVVLRPVRTEQVFSSGGTRLRKFAGVARSGLESRISFKVDGTIARLAVNVGARVKRGQLLAELDPEDYRLQVEDAQASLLQAQATERNASANYDRVRGLYENRNASKQDLDATRAAQESASAGVESAGKRLELARRQLDYCKLTAPLDGAVAEVPVEANENVSAGQTIVLLTSAANIEVEVAIPGVLIARIREGDPVAVYFDALGGQEFPGIVTEVGVAATGTATTFPVIVRLDATDADVRSGMAAEVSFTFTSEGAIDRYYVPSVAVGEDRDSRFVFVVDAGDEAGVGIVRRRQVMIGELTEMGLEIREGLSDGDVVVTAGVSKLVDGQEVRFEGAVER